MRKIIKILRSMENFISIGTLIEEAKKKGVDFGKGDPYNRLRYYTKIGWLPHMLRKKNQKDGGVEGHYPQSSVDRLVLIENLKAKGLPNDDIMVEIKKSNYIQSFYSILNSAELKTKIITYCSFLILLVILANELELINLGRPKSQILVQTSDSVPKEVIESGTAQISKGEKKIFIKNTHTNEVSKIYITFNSDFSPATRFWIGQKIPGDGFFVELDAPVSNNSNFNWWISN